MPVATVSRTQIAHVTQAWLIPLGPGKKKARAFTTNLTEPKLFTVGEYFTSVQGAIPLESEDKITNTFRFGPLIYEFQPSRLRTVFSLQSLIVNTPLLILEVAPELEQEGEIELEVGWIVNLNSAGNEYVAPRVESKIFKLPVNIAEGGVLEYSPLIDQQIQFATPVVVVPGSTLQVTMIPFVHILKNTGKHKNGQMILQSPLAEVESTICVLSYQQEFRRGNQR